MIPAQDIVSLPEIDSPTRVPPPEYAADSSPCPKFHLSDVLRSGRSLSALLFFVFVAFPGVGDAAEPAYVENEAPPPESAGEIGGTLSESLKREAPKAPRVSPLRKYLEGLPPFWRNTRLALKPRLYNFDRHNGGAPDQATFALGGAIEYRSGLWRDRIEVGLAGYTTQKLHGPKDAGGLDMLRSVQTGFGVLGQAYARIKLQPLAELRLYRQALNLPYFNRNDSRMIPNTFEAYLIDQPLPGRRLNWVAGHFTKIKLRGSKKFVPLSAAAGFAGTDDGASVAGLRWYIDDDTDFGIITFQAWNFMNITYAEAHTTRELTEEIPLSLSAQATYQGSTGSELGGDFGTYTLGARAAVSYRSAVLAFAGTYTDENAGIKSPFGGKPSYLSMMLADFDRAGEAAWLTGLSYHFGNFGFNGLSFNVKYGYGYGDGGDPNRDELDVTIDFKPQRDFMRGLWLRLRYATREFKDGRTRDDARMILNYEISLL